MKKVRYIAYIFAAVCIFSTAAHAATPPTLTAKGLAVYGWKDGIATPVLVKNEHRLYTIASITKLITAKTVEDLYKPEDIITISKSAAATEGTTPGIVAGAQFSRDDLLKALLISSSNDAASAFMETAGKTEFLKKMNSILHMNNYTSTSFVNPSGLDPAKKLVANTNRMTPYHLSILLNDIYNHDDLLRDIMSKDSAEITNLTTNTPVLLKQTNALYRDENYKDKVLMSKTGLTNLAGQNLAFIAPGNDTYEYMTVVFLGSKSRNVDSKKIIDWLDITYQNFGG